MNRLETSLCFQTTYEELKHSSLTDEEHTLKLLPDYLWGIETSLLPLLLLCLPLPDYLWGIETLLELHTFLKKQHGFQTTYEELKPTTSARPARFSNSFQTTYEELKHCFVVDLSDEQLGFQTTYEELKHLLGCFLEVIAFASRLPMRNWNLSSPADILR